MKYMDQNTKEPKSRRKPEKVAKGHKTVRVVLIVILAILLLACAGLFLLFRHYYGQSNYLQDSAVTQLAEGEVPSELLEDDISPNMNQQEQEEELEKAQAAQAEISFPNNENVYNILLIGSDRRDTSWYGNSDVMMLLSINKETKTLHLTSFMRDSYAVVGDRGGHKLNYAYAVGGGPLLVETIEENYKIDIDQYAAADFTNTAEIVDLVGGVDVTLTEAEANYLERRSYGEGAAVIDGAGTYHFNGNQAVAYARIRKIGNADYQRTERQRTIMAEIFEQAQSLSILELNDLANEILPLVTHNMSQGTVLSLLADLPTIISYELVLDRVPYDGLYYFRGEMLVPEWEETIARLHENIYGEGA